MDQAITLEDLLKFDASRAAEVRQADTGFFGTAIGARGAGLRDEGLRAGAQVCAYERTQLVNAILEKVGRQLDMVWNFGPLMEGGGRVVPPVISEVRERYTQPDNNTILLSGKTLKIDRQARFSGRPPSWREYLVMDAALTNVWPDRSLMPRDGDERKVWESSVKDGCLMGERTVMETMQANLARLTRDYTGMVRYHQLAMQKMVTLPLVADQRLPVTVMGNAMSVDEALLRLTAIPEFSGNIRNWRPVVAEHETTSAPADGWRSGAAPLIKIESGDAPAEKRRAW